MKHEHYYEVKAKSNYELGLILGSTFKNELEGSLDEQIRKGGWGEAVDKSKAYLEPTQHHFPVYIDELKGYARGAAVSFDELWALSMEDDTDPLANSGKCTITVTNNGALLSHNEDWEVGAGGAISILKKKVGELIIFEFYYHNTLGGCSASINSHGFFQGVSTLTHSGAQVGVPRNVIARWLSETNNPDRDFERMKEIPRQFGYSHVLVSVGGKVWNIEATAVDARLVKPQLPFVHTNHYLTNLKQFDTNDNSTGTLDRYEVAKRMMKMKMDKGDLEKVISDTSKGEKISIFNERTIGRMIVDFKEQIVRAWLLREKEKGWIEYEINFLN